MREKGFYWVKLAGEWMIGEYKGDGYDTFGSNWELCGSDRPFGDFEFDEIDERRLMK